MFFGVLIVKHIRVVLKNKVSNSLLQYLKLSKIKIHVFPKIF